MSLPSELQDVLKTAQTAKTGLYSILFVDLLYFSFPPP